MTWSDDEPSYIDEDKSLYVCLECTTHVEGKAEGRDIVHWDYKIPHNEAVKTAYFAFPDVDHDYALASSPMTMEAGEPVLSDSSYSVEFAPMIPLHVTHKKECTPPGPHSHEEMLKRIRSKFNTT